VAHTRVTSVGTVRFRANLRPTPRRSIFRTTWCSSLPELWFKLSTRSVHGQSFHPAYPELPGETDNFRRATPAGHGAAAARMRPRDTIGVTKPTCPCCDRKAEVARRAHKVRRSAALHPEGAELSLRCAPHLAALPLTAAHVRIRDEDPGRIAQC